MFGIYMPIFLPGTESQVRCIRGRGASGGFHMQIIAYCLETQLEMYEADRVYFEIVA